MRKSIHFCCGMIALALSIASCSHPPANIKIQQTTFDQALQESAQSSHYMVALLTTAGCSPCDLMKQHIQEDASFSKDFQQLSFYQFDITSPANKWLQEWLYETGTPIAVVFKPDGKLLTVINSGKWTEFTGILHDVVDNKKDSIYRFTNSHLHLKDTSLINTLQSSFNLYQQYLSGKHLEIQQSINTAKAQTDAHPYFFNTWLVSKSLLSIGDTVTARSYARQALSFNENRDFILYQQRRSELKYILDTSFVESQEPYAALDQTEQDLGLTTVGKKEVTFLVRNTGRKPLHIKDVIVSCSCLSVEWPHTPIEPGSTGKVIARYEIKKEGIFSQFAYIISDALNSNVILSVKGRVN